MFLLPLLFVAFECYDDDVSELLIHMFEKGYDQVFVSLTEAETTPGMFGDTVKTCFDYVDKWIESKFL